MVHHRDTVNRENVVTVKTLGSSAKDVGRVNGATPQVRGPTVNHLKARANARA